MEYIQPDMIGPFNTGDHWILTYEGKKIPFMYAFRGDKDQPDNIYVMFDGRMGFGPWTEEQLKSFLPLLANAMAYSAGYPCFGTDKRTNHFNCQMMGIEFVDTTEDIMPKLNLVKDE